MASQDGNVEELFVASVEYEEAKRLADLASILQDLTHTIETCKHLFDLLSEDQHGGTQDSVLIESLWTAALIRYVRCFSSGKRFGLSEDIFRDVPGDAVAAHRHYKNLRDKNIAHSVNPYEQVEVGLVLSPREGQERKVLGVSTLSMRHISETSDGVKQLASMAAMVRNKVAEMGKDYEQKILKAGEMLPIEELYSRARVRTVAPGPESSGEARQ